RQRRERRRSHNWPSGLPRRCGHPRSRPSSMRKASRRWEYAARILARSFAGSSTITAVSFARPILRRSNAGTCAFWRLASAQSFRPCSRYLLRKRCVGVNRPTTEIERVDVTSQAGKARFRQRHLAPPEPSHGGELGRVELDRAEARPQGFIEPDLDALVEHRVELAARQRLQAARIGRTATQDEAPAPGFEVLEREVVERKGLVDQYESGVGGILTDRDAQRISFDLDICERADPRSRMDHEHEAVPARIDGDDAKGQRRAEQADAAIGLREQRRGIDEGELDPVSLGNLLGEYGGTRGKSQPRAERGGGAPAGGDDHNPISAIGGGRGSRGGHNDLPKNLGANEVRAFW